MSAMTDYAEDKTRQFWFRTGTPTKPAALNIDLYTAAPGETGGGTKVTGGSYAAVARNPGDANWTAASGTDGKTDNAAPITYPAPTANWGTVTHVGINDGTNDLFYGALTNQRIINNGDAAPSFATGALSVTFA